MNIIHAQHLTVDQRSTAADAIGSSLRGAGNNGLDKKEVRIVIDGALGFSCSKGEFNKVLFKAHYRKFNGRYYAFGFGPKNERPVKPPVPEQQMSIANKESTTTIEGSIDEVVVKRGASKLSIKNVKSVTIITSTFVGALVILHLLKLA